MEYLIMLQVFGVGVLVGILIMKWINYEPSEGDSDCPIPEIEIPDIEVTPDNMRNLVNEANERKRADILRHHPHELSYILGCIKRDAFNGDNYTSVSSNYISKLTETVLVDMGFEVKREQHEMISGESSWKEWFAIISWAKPVTHDFTK